MTQPLEFFWLPDVALDVNARGDGVNARVCGTCGALVAMHPGMVPDAWTRHVDYHAAKDGDRP